MSLHGEHKVCENSNLQVEKDTANSTFMEHVTDAIYELSNTTTLPEDIVNLVKAASQDRLKELLISLERDLPLNCLQNLACCSVLLANDNIGLPFCELVVIPKVQRKYK